jgi:hypothetical protein
VVLFRVNLKFKWHGPVTPVAALTGNSLGVCLSVPRCPCQCIIMYSQHPHHGTGRCSSSSTSDNNDPVVTRVAHAT